MRVCRYLLAAVLFAATGSAAAATYTMLPGDDWTVLEAAQGGDVVEIAPGTYQFRVYLNSVGTSDNPIIIRAQDPKDRPVWDLGGEVTQRVANWPGSYSAGDLGRGAWQIGPDGAHYEISGIVFRNCRDSSSAGMRLVNSGPVKVSDCLFEYNTNGLTGASDDLVVEHCEFRENGQVWEGGNMTHNVYIYGGDFTMRYSYSHDSHEGQLFHVRAANSLIEYNWLSRPSSYVGDMMTCNNLCGGSPYEMNMTLRGNVIIQGEPQNGSQLLALLHDEATAPSAMNIELQYNTIIGTPRNPGQTHALLNMRNDTVATHAQLDNNIIYDVGQVASVEDPGLLNWSVDGVNNWVTSGADATGLSSTLQGDDPGFFDPADGDFTLVEGAAAQDEADTSVLPGPVWEYYQDEDNPMLYRERETADDLGAFEIGNSGSIYGPYGPSPDLNEGSGSGGGPVGGGGGGAGGGWAPPRSDDDGSCGCALVGARSRGMLPGLFKALTQFFL